MRHLAMLLLVAACGSSQRSGAERRASCPVYPERGVITVCVVDDRSGEPVTGAVVVMRRDAIERSQVTDPLGRVTFGAYPLASTETTPLVVTVYYADQQTVATVASGTPRVIGPIEISTEGPEYGDEHR